MFSFTELVYHFPYVVNIRQPEKNAYQDNMQWACGSIIHIQLDFRKRIPDGEGSSALEQIAKKGGLPHCRSSFMQWLNKQLLEKRGFLDIGKGLGLDDPSNLRMCFSRWYLMYH